MTEATDSTRRGNPKGGTNGPRGPAGFTLLDLIVTITLVAIMVGFAVPTISRTVERADARSTARSVANAFRQARNQAMSRGEPVLAEVDTQGQGSVILYRTDPRAASCLGASTTNVTQVDETAVSELTADRSIVGIAQRADDSRPNWLCFAPDGRVVDINGQVIQNKTCTAKNYRLWVADTGANVQGNSTLTGCPTSEKDRRTQKDERDLINMWVVDVPFNGAIRAHQ